MDQTDREMLVELSARYYEHRTGKLIRNEQREKLGEVIDSGILPKYVMDAVDLAVSRYGMIGTEKDYWSTIMEDLRNTYRLFVKNGLIIPKEKQQAAP